MEVILGLGLSILVVLAAAQHLVLTRNADRTLNVRADAQQEAHLALELIQREIRRAGYRTDPLATLEQVFAAQTIAFGDPPAVTELPAGSPLFVSAADELWLRFQAKGDRWDVDCLGPSGTQPGFVVVQRLWVDEAGLHCGVWREGGYESEVLLASVEAWSLALGVDLDQDGSVDAYVSRPEVVDWSMALGLSVKIRAVSSQADTSGGPYSFFDLDGSVRLASDRRIRRVASGVSALTARLP